MHLWFQTRVAHSSTKSITRIKHCLIAQGTSRRLDKFCTYASGPILASNAIKETHPTDNQVEERNKGGLSVLFRVDKAIDVNDRLSTHDFFERSNQKKVLEALWRSYGVRKI